MLHKKPCALVLWLVLAPQQLVRVGVFFDFCGKRLVREGVELLNADVGHIIAGKLFALFAQVVIDLARAQHQTLDFGSVLRNCFFLLGDDGLEAARSKV